MWYMCHESLMSRALYHCVNDNNLQTMRENVVIKTSHDYGIFAKYAQR